MTLTQSSYLYQVLGLQVWTTTQLWGHLNTLLHGFFLNWGPLGFIIYKQVLL